LLQICGLNIKNKDKIMAEIIRMPLMSDTMEEGNIVGWLKEVGDTIEAGDTLAEVETDKATMELDTYVDGVLLHIAVKDGPVPVDGVIAIIGEKGEDWKAALAEAEASTAATSSEPEAGETPAAMESEVTSEAPAEVAMNGERIKASPLARSMAKEAGIEISRVKGSGDNGRIVKRDVEAAISGGGAAPAPKADHTNLPAQVFNYPAPTDGYEDLPVSQMRKVIARRLGESKFSAPHFYLTIEIDMGETMKARAQINEMIAPSKVSFNDLIVKAAAGALNMHPAVNSSWLGDKIRINKAINIGVAVAVPDGLLVPVIRHADHKTLTQINAEVKDLAGKAKEKKLQPEEMQGNTFTISNLGMFGIEEFTAIINPPDACILAVGGIIQKPVVSKDGNIVVGQIMKVTLSCDHRVVDGVVGSQFLNTFKDLLEQPVRLLA
jgi:pyruvate dehydrogenase E2 component (dihydrolipoamide acetyltransferase)